MMMKAISVLVRLNSTRMMSAAADHELVGNRIEKGAKGRSLIELARQPARQTSR